MKKNLFFAAAIAVVAIFSSCTPAAEVEPTVTVKIDSASYKTGQGINGSITLTAGELSTVVLDSAGTVIKTYTTFTKAPITGSKESYIVKYDSLAAGKYTLKATLKTGQYGTKAFDVVKKTTLPIETLKEVTASVKINCTLNDGSLTTTCASVDGMVYEPKTATAAQQAKVDFVYFYKKMYSPSAAATDNVLKSAFASWTTSNITMLAKSSTLNYASSSLLDIANVLASPSTTKGTMVSDLAVNDVVAFTTSKGVVGMFKVLTITSGYTKDDYITIAIKVQK